MSAAEMDPSHRYFLSLGSNIQPDENLTRAITRLREHGKIDAVSSVWESEPIGSTGPNFLNLCLSIRSPLEPDEFRALVTRNIEAQMGRVRGSDRSAPRTIDIDILMVDESPLNLERWRQAFVVTPLAELLPQFIHPLQHEPLIKLAEKMRAETWIVPRAKAPRAASR